MIIWLVNKYSTVKPVVIDGILYVLIAMGGSFEAVLTSDDVYKYILPWIVFYLKLITAVFIAGVTALKMFRSTSYGDHIAAKKAVSNLQTGNTTTITKADVTPVQPDPSWSSPK